MQDVYCKDKFNELLINVQTRLLFNCCKAYPEKINLEWFEENPGRLFLTPTMIADRKKMLQGERCHSCDFGCYRYEDQGLITKRIKREGQQDKITDINHLPKTIDIALSNDCNLGCVYCGPGWSTTWVRDLYKNGGYDDDENLKLRPEDVLGIKMKQKLRSQQSRMFSLLSREIKLARSIEKINLLGGEPFLNDYIFDLIEQNTDILFIISTGLGLSQNRFEMILKKLKKFKNIELTISGEGTGKVFEMIRDGMTWTRFENYVQKLVEHNIKIKQFNCVMTNLCAFDVTSFYEKFSRFSSLRYGNVSHRPFLQPNVMDAISKKMITQKIMPVKDIQFFRYLKQEIDQPAQDDQRIKCRKFLTEFSQRRNLSLDILPKSFLDWLEIE